MPTSGRSSPTSIFSAGDAPGLETIQKHADQYLAGALKFSHALRRPPFPTETVHKLRTHLRRLQAYAELSERDRTAARLDHCVRWLSELRTLNVFQQYLRRRRGDAQDLRRVSESIREEERSLTGAGHLPAIRAVLAKTLTARLRRPASFMMARLASLGRDQAARMGEALCELPPKSGKKELHRLRLLVKSHRYQEELAQNTPWANPPRLAALKRLQRTLGDYCDLHQFRRLAKKMDLMCRHEIEKEYRHCRTYARAAVRQLGPPVF